jgi:hypothetical protein
MRKILIGITALAIHFFVLEIVLRLVLFGFTQGVFSPYQALLTKQYPELIPIFSQKASQEKDVKKILILGGSVVSTNWSQLEKKLATLLRPHFPEGTEIRAMNAAAPANTSLDNLVKYKALSGYHFDLVLFYEAINETRFNNLPGNLFKNDYSHIQWYRNIYLIIDHPELKFTVIPYTLHFIYNRLKDYYSKPIRLDLESVPARYVMYGSKIKTAIPYRKNIQELINTVKSRNQRLLLMSYASFFPEGVELKGDIVDNAFFGNCTHHSYISIWGDPENVQKGIRVHNEYLKELAVQNEVDFLDMDSLMPRRKKYFCDVCHLSMEQGAAYFATIIKNHILSKGLLSSSKQAF